MANDRSENLAKDKKLREKIEKLYKAIEKGFEDAQPRANEIKDNWGMYRGELGPKQLFYGRNQLYAPLVYDACRARAVRFTNQLFPQNGRHVECVSDDGTLPRAALAIVEHHIDHARLRELVPALCVAGDIEGNYNVYSEWVDAKRYTTRRVTKGVEAEPGIEAGDAEDIEEEEISVGGPLVEIIPDADICILPATAPTADDAIAQNGSVTILRRWNKAKINQMIDDEEIEKKAGETLLDNLDKKENAIHTDAQKAAVVAAGIKKDGRGDWALVYETWTNLKVDDKQKLCKIYMVGRDEDQILTARRNPLWCDKLPLLTVPVQRQPGTAKGEAPVNAVAGLQYFGNDVLNETADGINYELLPIIMRDPEAATAPLVLSPGAIWDVAPAMVQAFEMASVSEKGMGILNDLQQKIMQTLSVNPATLTQGPSKPSSKKNQAEIAQQQQVEILTTADAVTIIEAGILTPLVGLFLDLDYQYRDAAMLTRQYGEMGQAAVTEMIAPLQNDTRYTTKWIGVEVARNAQMIQQKIAFLGVLRALPPAMYPNHTLDAEPVISEASESIFGPQQGRLVFKDNRMMSANPNVENEMMDENLYVEVHPMDNDAQHMTSHKLSIEQDGDMGGIKMAHLQKHAQQAMVKQAAQKMALSGGDSKGGAGQPAPAQAGQPNQTPPGGQPRGPQGMQQPAGSVPQDSMNDPSVMPRE